MDVGKIEQLTTDGRSVTPLMALLDLDAKARALLDALYGDPWSQPSFMGNIVPVLVSWRAEEPPHIGPGEQQQFYDALTALAQAVAWEPPKP